MDQIAFNEQSEASGDDVRDMAAIYREITPFGGAGQRVEGHGFTAHRPSSFDVDRNTAVSLDDRLTAAALDGKAEALLRGQNLTSFDADTAFAVVARANERASQKLQEADQQIARLYELMRPRQLQFEELDALFAGPIVEVQESWPVEKLGLQMAEHLALSRLLQLGRARLAELQVRLSEAQTVHENLTVLYELARVRIGAASVTPSLLRRLALDPATTALDTPIADTRRAADAQIAAKREREAAEKRAKWEREAAAAAAQREAEHEARQRENIAYTARQEGELLTAWRTDPKSAPEFKRRLVNRIVNGFASSQPMWRAWIDGASDGKEIVKFLEGRLNDVDGHNLFMTHALETLIRCVKITTGQPIESAQAA